MVLPEVSRGQRSSKAVVFLFPVKTRCSVPLSHKRCWEMGINVLYLFFFKKMAGSARGKSFERQGSTFFRNKTRSEIIFGNLWQYFSRCFGRGAEETIPSFTLPGHPPRWSLHAAFIRMEQSRGSLQRGVAIRTSTQINVHSPQRDEANGFASTLACREHI